MTESLLAGVLVAWGVAQVAVGVFFCLVFAWGRRERDYLLFGFLCFALALTTGGMAWMSLATSPEIWLRASQVVLVGSIMAPALNLHYALRYAAPERARSVALAAYAAATFFELANLLGLWWRPGTAVIRPHSMFGGVVLQGGADPTPLAVVYFAVTGIQLVGTQLLFLRAYRRGDREALIAFVGGLFVFAAGSNDILMATGVLTGTLYALPHAFMLYAFAVASTLVLRYRLTAGELLATRSHLRQATEELRVSHAELREVQSTLETKEQLAAVGELAASIAHEVRNPLAIISNAVAGLRRAQAGGADQRVLLDIVEEETGRLNRLVTDLLRFARPASLRPAPVDLGELAQSVVGNVEAGPPQELRVEAAPVQIDADESLLRVALCNLLENARQASAEGGTIVVAVDECDLEGKRYARIEVRDQGNGMDESVMARAGEPFYTTRPSGTGLGLPIVQRIVRAHGGKLELESKLARGTTARMLLPAERASGAPPERMGEQRA